MSETSVRPPAVPFGEAVKTWARIAALSFGGPAGQIAVMHRILVEEKRWLGERRFLHALNYCMLLPGPEAQQLAIYIGWLMHRTAGGLVAGLLFVLPGFLAIMALSILYALYGGAGPVSALFFGLKAAVLVACDDAPRAILARLPAEISYHAGHLGILAARAAFTAGGPWRAQVIAMLDRNRALLAELLARHLPTVGYAPPAAGYLAWLDGRALGLSRVTLLDRMKRLGLG